MSDSNASRYKPDPQAEAALRQLTNNHAALQQHGTNNSKLNEFRPLVAHGRGRKFPVNLTILFCLFLASVYVFLAYHHDEIVLALPDKHKGSFLKFVQPIIDTDKGESSKPLTLNNSQLSENKEHQSSISEIPAGTKMPDGWKPPPRNGPRLVQIDGAYYKWNERGIYIVNGEKIFFKDERER